MNAVTDLAPTVGILAACDFRVPACELYRPGFDARSVPPEMLAGTQPRAGRKLAGSLPGAVNRGVFMHFDLAQLATADAYKLLVSTVVPRPIALATTTDGGGRINAAPFSFFNAVSSVPPVVDIWALGS